METYCSWVTIFWATFDACYTSKHPFFSGFEAEKGLHVIHACVVYTVFYGNGCHRFLTSRTPLYSNKTWLLEKSDYNLYISELFEVIYIAKGVWQPAV